MVDPIPASATRPAGQKPRLPPQTRVSRWPLTFFFARQIAAGGGVDPVNIVAFPIAAPTALGVLGTALAWGGIAGGTQAAIELAGAPYRERVQPGYGASSEPAANVIGGAAVGGAIGGTIKAAAMGWNRWKGEAWPRTVRDAGNVIESEAHIEGANPFGSVEGEVAHRAALGKTVDDLVAGRPPDVEQIITPDLQAEYQARFVSIDEARQRAVETKAPEDVGDVAFELQGMARQAGYTLPRNEADQIAARLVEMPDTEARATLDEFMLRPNTIAETLPDAPRSPLQTASAQDGLKGPEGELGRSRRPSRESLEKTRDAALREANLMEAGAGVEWLTSGERSFHQGAAAMHRRMAAELDRQITAGEATKATTAPDTDATVLRDLDKLRAQRGDIEIPMGETIDAAGQRVPHMRKVDDLMDEADARQLAAREIMECVGPQPGAGQGE